MWNRWYDLTLVFFRCSHTDFSELFPKRQRRKLGCDVFNGISVTEDPDILYVTGKKWDRMFKVQLLI